MALPFVVHESEWTIARLIDHVDHLAQTIGVRHVCLGGDFARQLERSGAFGVDALDRGTEIEGLAGPEDYPRLFEALGERGYGDDDLRAIASENLAARAAPHAARVASAQETRTMPMPRWAATSAT